MASNLCPAKVASTVQLVAVSLNSISLLLGPSHALLPLRSRSALLAITSRWLARTTATLLVRQASTVLMRVMMAL